MVTNVTLVVLAAGLGSRYGKLKQLDRLGPHGETLLDYTLFDALEAGFSSFVFVIREEFADEFRSRIADNLPAGANVDLVSQKMEDLPPGIPEQPDRTKPWGTGHALLAAGCALRGPFGIINADDYYGKTSFVKLYEYLETREARSASNCLLVTFELMKTLSDHGPVSRAVCEVGEDGTLSGMVERTHIRKVGENISYCEPSGDWTILKGKDPVSMNMFGLNPGVLPGIQRIFSEFLRQNAEDPAAEFFLPAALNQLVDDGELRIRTSRSDETWFGLTYSEDKQYARTRIADMIRHGRYPARLW